MRPEGPSFELYLPSRFQVAPPSPHSARQWARSPEPAAQAFSQGSRSGQSSVGDPTGRHPFLCRMAFRCRRFSRSPQTIGLGHLSCNGRCTFDYFCSTISYHPTSRCTLVLEAGHPTGHRTGKEKKKKKKNQTLGLGIRSWMLQKEQRGPDGGARIEGPLGL